MLIMKCSKCQKYIESELLVELSTVECEHCGTVVPVKNILVSSNGFTFDRDDLLKRFFRYRKLLDEVIDEHNALEHSSSASSESKQSISQFLSILQGMMTGARANFRCRFQTPVVVDVRYSRHSCYGRFVNLSMEGACIDLDCKNPLPRVGSVINLQFSLSHVDVEFKVSGIICWVKQGKSGQDCKHDIGVKFDPLDPSLKDLLWEVIIQQAGGKKEDVEGRKKHSELSS